MTPPLDVQTESTTPDWLKTVTAPVSEHAARIAWLGQAGFALRWKGGFALIDPYLSDSLREKYAGSAKPHDRMMPPPVTPDGLRGVHVVLATHAHSDHLDPGTLPVIARNHPDCFFVVPRAIRKTAVARGCPEKTLVLLNAGETVTLHVGLTVTAIAAAHEDLEQNANGDFLHLGYVLRAGRITLYHSGDCVPYPGLTERVATAAPHVALLPVNGRDASRRAQHIIGNFTFDEAVALCEAAGVSLLIPHHWGMFRVNTVDPTFLQERIAANRSSVRIILPNTKEAWLFSVPEAR